MVMPFRNRRAEVISDIRPGERSARLITRFVGSWPFIVLQTLMIAAWLLTDGFGFDPKPWATINVVLWMQVSTLGPLILLTINRMDRRDETIELLEGEELSDMYRLLKTDEEILVEIREQTVLYQEMIKSLADVRGSLDKSRRARASG